MGDYVDYVFGKARDGAVVLANWESYTGMLYAQKVEGKRPDLTFYSVPVEGLDEAAAEIKAQYPSSQMLISRSFYIEKESDIYEFGREHPLSLKGRTYQDFSHGKPYPVAAQLFEGR